MCVLSVFVPRGIFHCSFISHAGLSYVLSVSDVSEENKNSRSEGFDDKC